MGKQELRRQMLCLEPASAFIRNEGGERAPEKYRTKKSNQWISG